MEKLILASILSLAAGSYAATSSPVLRCTDKVNKSYSATFSQDKKSLAVYKIHTASSERVAVLNCSSDHSDKPHYPDQMFIATCSEPILRDAGYSAVHKVGGLAGFNMVILSEVSFSGSKEIARLVCR